jgi:hypothetical protein
MRPLLRILILFLAASCAAALGTAACQAGMVLASETVSTSPGGTGFVQILLTNNFATDQTLSGFSADIALGGAGVHFTGVDDQTNPGYVFDGFGTGVLTFDAFPNAGFVLSDVSLNADGFVTLAAGQTVGLGRIAFAVDAGASLGLRPITFETGPTTQFVVASDTTYADVSFVSGGVNVLGPATTPEPPTAVLLLLGSGLVAACHMVRYRHT